MFNPPFMQQLEIKNLRVAIGENEIIRDLSLSVGLGEMHAVMGPNGSGKISCCFPRQTAKSGYV